MSGKIDILGNDADKFASMVTHYTHNAKKYLKNNDYHKASEMMWGAMSCLVKTYAAKENVSIKSHRELKEYAKMLACRENNKEFLISFSHAGILHKNFYESNLEPGKVSKFMLDITKTIGKLMVKMKYVAP